MSLSTPLLKVENVTRHFGGLEALGEVTLSVNEGEVRGIIGPNGAGKTTLFNVITGELPVTSGAVYLRGQKITGLSPDKICQMGMGRTFQMTLIFPELTVFDSIWVGVNARSPTPWHPFKLVDAMKDESDRVRELAAMVGLEGKLHERAVNLSYGDQKVLEIAMALSTRPVLLLLDEPTQGVSPQEAEMILTLIKRLSEKITIVLIEHSIEFVVRLCGNLTVLNRGRVLAEGTPEEISRDTEVRRVYLGGDVWNF